MEAYFPRKALPMHRRPFWPQGVLFVVLNHLRSLCAELQLSEHGKASNTWKFSPRKLYFSPIWKVFSLESFLLYDISCLCLRTNDMDGLLPLQFLGCTPVPSFILRPPPFFCLFFVCFGIIIDISHLLYCHNRARWAIIVIICPFRGTREIWVIICPLKQHHWIVHRMCV